LRDIWRQFKFRYELKLKRRFNGNKWYRRDAGVAEQCVAPEEPIASSRWFGVDSVDEFVNKPTSVDGMRDLSMINEQTSVFTTMNKRFTLFENA